MKTSTRRPAGHRRSRFLMDELAACGSSSLAAGAATCRAAVPEPAPDDAVRLGRWLVDAAEAVLHHLAQLGHIWPGRRSFQLLAKRRSDLQRDLTPMRGLPKLDRADRYVRARRVLVGFPTLELL